MPPKYPVGSVIIEVDQLLSVALVGATTPVRGLRRLRLAVQNLGAVTAGKHRLTAATRGVAAFRS